MANSSPVQQTRSQMKPSFHPQYQSSTAPQTPPKKTAATGRGVPPPIPPNKPVIPCKQTAVRRPDSAETDKKKQSNTISSKDGGVGGGGGVSSGETSLSKEFNSQGIEILGQELADFQQMFVTMATSNNT